jgi:hypothetical protein
MPEIANKLKEHRFVAPNAFSASITASAPNNNRSNARPKPGAIPSKIRQKSYQDSIAYPDDGRHEKIHANSTFVCLPLN